MTEKMANGDGFIAALDQSGGSTPKALRGYGIEESAYSNDDEMFALIHAMRSRIITAPSFNGDKVVGAILFERTMNGNADGKPVPQILHDRGVVPFLKIDKGLEDESDGVQMMKPMPGLDELLAHAKELGIFGTKERSVVHAASKSGIAAIVRQQFEVGMQVVRAGLMPILEPEVSLKSPDRDAAEKILLEEIRAQLDALPDGTQVMLKLTIPATPDLYKPLVDHPAVLRVVALSGGYSRDEACDHLKQNHGMIASFSRALLEDLRAQMSDEEFDAALASAIDQIYQASTQKS
ncbi:fructose bisphosphate aldolase [Stakelama sediminis]|uniref:fructose-bisphosphate aldolase n=2 Tax=Stakelama sediminis TaxID=463200 RepID=A0A840YYL2_9SPHN|nr:fructose-bisphosphate aldolase class I [Stakelama sediminis]